MPHTIRHNLFAVGIQHCNCLDFHQSTLGQRDNLWDGVDMNGAEIILPPSPQIPFINQSIYLENAPFPIFQLNKHSDNKIGIKDFDNFIF